MTKEAVLPRVFTLYRLLWGLYPASFRADFCDEIMCDFVDATNRAWNQNGWSGVLSLVAIHVWDWGRNLFVVWFRTGIPTLIAVSASCSALLFGLVALQGVASTNPAFVTLHVVWLAGGGAVVLCALALGSYHGKHTA